jgi:hypothetical protein
MFNAKGVIMRRLKYALASVVVSVLVGCGGGGDEQTVASSDRDRSTATPSTEKNLFSLWTDVGTGVLLDLRNMSFGPGNVLVADYYGLSCTCTLGIYGTQQLGRFELSRCAETANPRATAVCGENDGTDRYSKSNNRLTLTYSDGESNTYR